MQHLQYPCCNMQQQPHGALESLCGVTAVAVGSCHGPAAQLSLMPEANSVSDAKDERPWHMYAPAGLA